jgi:hypothetical protein
MAEQAELDAVPRRNARALRRTLLWAIAVGLTYLAGKFAVDAAKWLVLLYLAPAGEAKLIMVGYLAGASLPVLLFALPAGWSWWRLWRAGERVEAALMLGVELAFLTYVGAGELGRALENFIS